MHYFYILITIVLTVYGQLIVKWQVSLAGAFPVSGWDKTLYLGKLLINPWVMSSMAAALLAGVAYMAALTQLELSQAYPLMGFSFVLILILSAVYFQEPITWVKVIGVFLIVGGSPLAARDEDLPTVLPGSPV